MRRHQRVNLLRGFGDLSLLATLLDINHLVRKVAKRGHQIIHLFLRIPSMDHDPDARFALGNLGIVNRDHGDFRQLQVEKEPPVVLLPGPDGHNVRHKVQRLIVLGHGNRQDAQIGGFVPDVAGGDGFEEVFDEMLNVVLGLVFVITESLLNDFTPSLHTFCVAPVLIRL